MADYAQLDCRVRYGETSDFSDGVLDRTFTSSSTTPVKQEHQLVSAATAGGTTIELGNFATIQYVMVKNKDATNFVTAAFTSVGTGGASTQKLLAGRFVVLTDVVVANDLVLVADTAACDVEVVIIGT